MSLKQSTITSLMGMLALVLITLIIVWQGTITVELGALIVIAISGLGGYHIRRAGPDP